MSNQGLPTHSDTAPLPLKPPPAETPSLTLLLASTYCCCCCLCSLPPLPCPSGVISLLCAKNLVSECVLYGLKGALLPYNTFWILGVFQKWTFLSPMVICLLAFYFCFALSVTVRRFGPLGPCVIPQGKLAFLLAVLCLVGQGFSGTGV